MIYIKNVLCFVVVVVDIRSPVVLDGFLLEVLGWGWGRFRRGTGERREFGETWVGGEEVGDF